MRIERQLQGTLNTIFTEVIKEKGLEKRILPYSVIEENRADITLKNRNGKPILFVELKDPRARDGRKVFDGDVILRELSRAQKNNINYFGNCNFLDCAFYDVKDIDKKVSITGGFLTIIDIERLSINYILSKEIENKLRKIVEFYLERAIEILDNKPVKFTPIDELFIFQIRTLIELYAIPISTKIWEKYNFDKSFKREISNYTKSQLWNIPTSQYEIENLTHISLLMLISKLIFYKSYIDNQLYTELSPMILPDNIKTVEEIENWVWNYFEEFKEVTDNFELLIGERSEIIFKMPFVSDAIIELIKEVLKTEKSYNFSKIPFDVIGRIFEELIRPDERHTLGQYFTPSNVIDFINSFVIKRSKDTVFDPSCGSGTFLVRAYERKKKLYIKEGFKPVHKKLLNEIYGNDLSNYPAYLSMLNLAIRNSHEPSYPRITNKDFFSINNYDSKKLDFHNSNGEKEKRKLPKFDVIIGNPPYTRQEDIGTMFGTVSKDKINALIKTECGFPPSQRTSIYAYFFYHANEFLREGGYLAYICQNSWLDADYGADLQRFMLNNFEIMAIIDSEIERFFPTASVNTTIVILKKQRDEDLRNNNNAKFIYLKQPLKEILQIFKDFDLFQSEIFKIQESIETELFRINCIKQKTLFKDIKWGQYLRAPKIYFDILEKGKDVFCDLNNKKGLSDVKRGITTGCNDYFYGKENLDEKHLNSALNNFEHLKNIEEVQDRDLCLFINAANETWLIEKRLLKPVLKLTRNLNKYIIDKTDKTELVFYVNDVVQECYEKIQKNKGDFNIKETEKYIKRHYPYASRYINHGETKFIVDYEKNIVVAETPTCKVRPIWFDVGKQPEKDFVLLRFRDRRNWTPIVDCDFILGDTMFYGNFKDKKLKKLYAISLNSTFSILQTELFGRVNLGDGLLTTYGTELKKLKVISKENKEYEEKINDIYQSLKSVEVKSIFEELGTENAENIDMSKIAVYRLAIDNLFLEILGYKCEQERKNVLSQIYKATLHIINSRATKAKSQDKQKSERKSTVIEAYMKQLNELLIDNKSEAKATLTFAKELNTVISEITLDKRLQKRLFDTYWQTKFNKNFNEKEVANTNQQKINFQ